MNVELIEALEQISKEKGIDKQIIIDAIELSLVTACKKNYGTSQNVKVIMNRETGDVSVYAQKTVVDDLEDEATEILLDKAQEIDRSYLVGDIANIEITPRDFGRIAAQTAKQVVLQKIREAEREIIYNEYVSKEKDIITGIIQNKNKNNVVLNFGRIEALLPQNEQVRNEVYQLNSRLKVYVLEVKQTTKGPQILVSRTHPELVKRLFEQEVPEIYEGIVQIKSVSREAGSRTKMAVYTKDENVDPVGACIGQNGQRVNPIIHELQGEKIDIVPWSEDEEQFIFDALSPAKVISVELEEENKIAKVIVPENQFSLAIGKEGQNVRLAARLTGWKIDIKTKKVTE